MRVVVLCVMARRMAAVAAVEYPPNYQYTCNGQTCMFVYNGNSTADAADCMRTCAKDTATADTTNGGVLSDSERNLTITTSMSGGSCTNCAWIARTRFDFPRLFKAYGVTAASLGDGSCNFKARVKMLLPPEWNFYGTSSTCKVAGTPVDCARGDKTMDITLSAAALGALMQVPKNNSYEIRVDQVSTRKTSGNYTFESLVELDFSADPCVLSMGDGNKKQAFSVLLDAPSYELKGKFTEMSMVAENPVIVNTTTVHISFRSGAILQAGSIFVLRVSPRYEKLYEELISSVNAARLRDKTGEHVLNVTRNEANLSMTIPPSYTGTIQNGDQVVLSFDNFRTPVDEDNGLDRVFLAAFQYVDGSKVVAVDYSPVDFFQLAHGMASLLCELSIGYVLTFALQ